VIDIICYKDVCNVVVANLANEVTYNTVHLCTELIVIIGPTKYLLSFHYVFDNHILSLICRLYLQFHMAHFCVPRPSPS